MPRFERSFDAPGAPVTANRGRRPELLAA